MDVPRQCVFAGTTNQDEYLKDATGNRRYWPVACTKVDLDLLREIRDQLWAEAVFCYEVGDIWWVNRDEAPLFAEAQEERFVVDDWEGPILNWLEESQLGETTTGSEILSGPLKLDAGQPPEGCGSLQPASQSRFVRSGGNGHRGSEERKLGAGRQRGCDEKRRQDVGRVRQKHRHHARQVDRVPEGPGRIHRHPQGNRSAGWQCGESGEGAHR